MKGSKQTTLRDEVTVTGVGVHSGRNVTLALLPADDDAGIVFRRVDAEGNLEREVRADVRAVTATEFATVLGDASGPLCSTAEHLLAALRGLQVDNVIVEIDGPEVPMMDGSAAAFVALIDSVGLAPLAASRRFIKVLKPVRVDNGASFAELLPFDGRRFEIDIEFSSALIGRQSFAIDLTPHNFRRDLARARTFGFLKDVEFYMSRGLALGSSLENTVVLGDDRVLNPEGLRFADEFARHKTLDAVGDLALAGAPILGAYRSYRGGHKLNAKMVEALLADSDAWTFVGDFAEPRRQPVRAEIPVRLREAAFGPDKS